MGRPRRASSNLGGDPRGDTSAPALATMTTRSSTSEVSVRATEVLLSLNILTMPREIGMT